MGASGTLSWEMSWPAHQTVLSLYSATARRAPMACWEEPVRKSAPAFIWVWASSDALTKSPKLPVWATLTSTLGFTDLAPSTKPRS